MKVGVFGDIHANLEAFEQVLRALMDRGCEAYCCTGDIVGYGPDPAGCIHLLRENDIPCVLGNHDKYVTLIASPQVNKLDPGTRASVEWTQSVLDMEDLHWLAELPLRLDFEPFTVIHGSFGKNRWAYLVNEKNLEQSFENQDVALAFSGHSHLPVCCLQMPGHKPHMSFLRTTTLPAKAEKILINPGSVGQPRDRDPRASCLVYDTDERSVQPLRVEYDIEATQKKMREADLPERFVERLENGR